MALALNNLKRVDMPLNKKNTNQTLAFNFADYFPICFSFDIVLSLFIILIIISIILHDPSMIFPNVFDEHIISQYKNSCEQTLNEWGSFND